MIKMVYIETPYHTSDLPEDLRIDLLSQIRAAERYRARVARIVDEELKASIKNKTGVVIEDRILLKHNIKDPAHPKVKLSLFVQIRTKVKTLINENYKTSPSPIPNNSITCVDMCYESKNGEVDVACGVQSTVDDMDSIKSLEATLSDWLRWIGDDAYSLVVRRWKELYSDEVILDYCEKERVVYRPKDETLLIPSYQEKELKGKNKNG
jgi:hypothetical protein